MSTQLWLLAGAAAYMAVLVLVLSLVMTAKRADEDAARAAVRERPPSATVVGAGRRRAVIEASSPWLARRMFDAHGALSVERIAVVLRDPADPRTWVVEACAGVPGVCGTVITAEAEGGFARVLTSEDDEGRPWSVGSAAIAVRGHVVGEVVIATRHAGGLRRHDRELLERFAALLARHVHQGVLDTSATRGAA